MRRALEFLYNLKFIDKVTPLEADYNVADDLFKEGNAAYIINGDWTLDAYAAAPDAEAPGLGDNLGVGALPLMTGGEDPKPYVAGTYFMVPKQLAGDELTIAADFMNFATNPENQVGMVEVLKRLPGNAEAFASDVVTGDPLLAASADAAAKGVAQPVQLEMRCVFDAMTAVPATCSRAATTSPPCRRRCSRPQIPASASCNRVASGPGAMPGPRPTRWGRRTR